MGASWKEKKGKTQIKMDTGNRKRYTRKVDGNRKMETVTKR